MRAIIALALLAGASAEGCVDGKCTCRDEPTQHTAVMEGFKAREDILALSKNSQWKMRETYNALDASQLKDCGSCEFEKKHFKKMEGKKGLQMRQSLADPEKIKKETKMDTTTNVEWKKIYYINLDQSVDRKNKLMYHSDKWTNGIPLERYPAFTRQRAKEFNISHFTPKGIAGYMEEVWGDGGKWGTTAVFLSHVTLLEKIWKEDPNGEGLYVILEDDAEVGDPDWKNKVENMFRQKKVPEDWDMLKIGYWGAKRCQDYVSDEILEARAPGFSPDGKEAFYGGNVAYIVRPKSVPMILEQLRGSELYDVDGATMSLHKEGTTADEVDGLKYHWSWGAHTYVTKNPLVWGGLGKETLRLKDAGHEKVALLQSEATKMSRIFNIKADEHKKIQDRIVVDNYASMAAMPPPWLEWGDFA